MIRVFISSVQREFAEERQLLCKYIREDALLGKFFLPFIFEELPAINLSAPEAYLTEASTSDIYLGLYGHDYGYEDAEGISPTEREYDAATANNRHRIVFIKRCDERNPKEQNFIHKVEQDVVRKSFADYDELRTAVYAALIRFLEEKDFTYAVAHRYYTDNGSVQVMLFQDRLEVWNPGLLPYGLTIPQLEEPHKSQPHNPLIAEPMFLKGYIEKAGTGTEDIITKCVNYGLEKPEFHQDSDFKVTIWRRQVGQKTSEVGQKTSEVDQKTDEVGQKTDEVIEKIPQVTRKRTEVDHKIEQLSQKAHQLSQKMSQKTFESILYAINNDAYVSIKTMELLANCGKTTVKRYLSFLTENGFISCWARQRWLQNYQLVKT